MLGDTWFKATIANVKSSFLSIPQRGYSKKEEIY